MNDSGTWTIGELAERAAIALGAEPAAPRNGRIRDVPNERLIRWYVTIGLMDPPLGRRGRVALYGPRHLLQLLAVKRRQAGGRSLADIQAELTGATDATLRAIARLPEPDAGTTARPADGGETGGETGGATGRSAPSPNRERFWAVRPSAAAPAVAAASGPAVAPAPVEASAPLGATDTSGTDSGADSGADFGMDPGAAAQSADAGPEATEATEAAVPAGNAAGKAAGHPDESDTPDDRAGLVYGIRLAPGVRLLLDADSPAGVRSPGAADLAALRAAARPLLEALARGGHVALTPDHDSLDPGHGRGLSSAEGKSP